MRRNSRVPRITDAARSHKEELRRREVRYVLMMLLRAACLVVVTVLVSVHAPLLFIWIPALAIAALVLPWAAVILANDRLPREKYKLAHRRRVDADQVSLTAGEARGEEPVTIDIDPETGFATYRANPSLRQLRDQ